MSFFPFLHFFNFIVYGYLAVFILIKDAKALVNRILVGFLLCFCLWSFSFVFLHHPFCSEHLVKLFVNISSIGWCSFSSFFFWFILAFTGKKKILKKKWFYLLLFGIPLVFIYLQWNGFIFVDYIKEYYGWKGLYGKSIWPYLFFSYYLSFMGLGIYIILNFIKKNREPVLKKQAKIISFTMVISVLLGSITDVLLTLLDIHVIPNIADSFLLVWAFGIVYAMVRYKFLIITPAAAADNIISTMHDCLILLNLEGNIVTANKATLDTLGYEENELNGTAVSTLFTAAEINRGVVDTITSEGNFKDKELAFKTKEGKEVPVLSSKSVLKDNAGIPGGIVCVAKDISERKRLEEEILKSKKLESIGILAGGIAHDFNNLLSVILGNISLAQLEVSSQDKVYKFLLDLEKAALKAGELTEKFISFSRGGWLKKEQVILSLLLKDVMALEPGLQETNISCHIDIPDHLLPIHGDKRQLNQVMQNLFLNAVEAMPGEEGGWIAVSAENTTITLKNQFQLKPGKYVRILIEDNGGGIPDEIIDKVFDPYFSTRDKTNQKGMGLGLTLCYSIIKKHNGHIAVESQKGKGTTVTLYLPAFIDRR